MDKTRVGTLGRCHLQRDCGQTQIMLSSAGYKERHRCCPAGPPVPMSTPGPGERGRDAACEQRSHGVLPGAEKLQKEFSYSWAVSQTLFPFSPTNLCNPCFKALKARDYSGNAKTGWHIVAFADSVREDNKICISFVRDRMMFSLYSNYNHWEKLRPTLLTPVKIIPHQDLARSTQMHISEMTLCGQKCETRFHSSSVFCQLC